MLTAKQEKFVQELIKGKSQREAYRIAYPTSLKWLDTSIDCEAAKTLKIPKVLQRYNELRDKSANNAVWTREQAINDLVYIKNKCSKAMILEKENDETGEEMTLVDSKVASVAISAIKELNMMNGYNESNVNMKIDKVVIGDDI